MIAHMHNVRVMWMEAAKADEIPEQLDRATGPKAGRRRAVQALNVLIGRAVEGNGRIKNFRPDLAGFIGYLIAHDATIVGKPRCLRANPDILCRRRPCGTWEWGSR